MTSPTHAAMRRAPARRVVAALAVVTFVAAAIASSAGAATSGTVVTATIPSASWIDSTGCASGTAGSTDLGIVLPATSAASTVDCTVQFGSSNDTSMLRMYQQDRIGTAMWRAPTGPLDTDTGDGDSFSVDGFDQRVLANAVMESALVQRVGAAAGGTVAAGWYPSGPSMALVLMRWNPDGTPDNTFGSAGLAVIDAPGRDEMAFGLFEDPTSGALYAVGYDEIPVQSLIARFTPTGALDTTFSSGDGSDGYRIDPTVSYYMSGKVLPDGSIVLASSIGGQFGVVKLSSTGSPVTSFGTGGKVTIGQDGSGQAIDVAADGSLIVAGQIGSFVCADPTNDSGLAKFTANGVLDTSFATNGVWKQDLSGQGNLDEFYEGQLKILPDGRIVVGGLAVQAAGSAGVVARFTAGGALDASFSGGDGTNGWLADRIAGAATEYRSMTVDDVGRIITGGTTANAGEDDPVVVRYTSVGARDTTFNGTGAAIWSDSPTDMDNTQVGHVAAPDGKYIVIGDSTAGVGAYRLDTARVADYANGVTDWDQGSSAFGACMRAIGGAAATDVGTWSVGPGNACPLTDGAYWNAVPAQSPGAKLAKVTAPDAQGGGVDPSVSIRFGFRAAADQPPGQYTAPVTFDVIAPNS